ncbi:39S ribosomal protein L46, mitochondrial [Cichlidogyrus casuarinus]|uniref:39S ribosomal protein L46, mitochondrial n=1 Tax=Cichlidogyrus casuarinus TaxID=1844966 RepID=A0ABD2QHD4_9PLAT
MTGPAKIFTGLCIKRLPVVNPLLKPIENKVMMLKRQMEFEHSSLSKHEYRAKIEASRSKEEQANESKELSDTALMTAAELETQWESNLDKFKAAPKLTDNDVKRDFASPWHSLDSILYLLVKQKLGKNAEWGFPVVEAPRNVPLWKTAQDFADLLVGQAKPTIIGNLPVAVHKYKFQSNEVKTPVQMYFYHSYINKLHRDPKVMGDGIEDHVWVKRCQIPDYINARSFLKTINSFVVEY